MMLPPRLRPKLYAKIGIAIAISVLSYFLRDVFLTGLSVFFWAYLLFDFIKREPEIVAAEAKMEKAQKPWTYGFIVLVIVGVAFTDTEKPGLLDWIVLSGILAIYAAYALIWPGIVFHRAQEKVRERKQREAA